MKPRRGDEAEAKRLLETSESNSDVGSSTGLGLGPEDADRMNFPQPEKIGDSSSSSKKEATVVSLKDTWFQYEGAESPVLCGVDVKLTSASRVGIVGSNGCGKSTLLGLLAGRLQPSSLEGMAQGELVWHKGLRLAYIAQHSLAHLANYLSNTPLEYMQLRYRRGFDEELPRIENQKPPTRKEAEDLHQLGVRHGKRGKQVEALLSRIDQKEGNEMTSLYEVQWKDLGPGANSFETMTRLKSLKALHLAQELDERILTAWAGTQQRPLTRREVVQHLEPFGLSEDVICERKISMLSSGQKCKVAFGAAFWTRPHFVCLDEPTNYLDVETVELLQRAIRNFRGGVAVVTHSEKFVEAVCTEVWDVAAGKVTVRHTGSNGAADPNLPTKGESRTKK